MNHEFDFFFQNREVDYNTKKNLLRNYPLVYSAVMLNATTEAKDKKTYVEIVLENSNTLDDSFKKQIDKLYGIIKLNENDLIDTISRTIKTKWRLLVYEFEVSNYFSKDDTYFYIIDNPIRKDKVFKMPYISPSMWKGMLRFMAEKQSDKESVDRIFGKEKKDNDGTSGNIKIYPSFFSKIRLEVINPMNYVKKVGTLPIYFEVVSKDDSKLIIFYLPKFHEQEYIDTDTKIIDEAVKNLFKYGISAKRSSGWGKAKIKSEKIYPGEAIWKK
ncbi:MAG: RAMP superfamily CRISPR-associated protein [Desulfurella sp.]|uniref:RAMP superfamily CRISPR-associated protein n=1 Tax=Desulfurella sp. TaxID=1962857 RepID=UPI003D10659A